MLYKECLGRLREFGVPKSGVKWAAKTVETALEPGEIIRHAFSEYPQGKFQGVIVCTGSRIVVARKQTNCVTDSFTFDDVESVIADVDSYSLRIIRKLGGELGFQGAYPVANAERFADFATMVLNGEAPKVNADEEHERMARVSELREVLGSCGVPTAEMGEPINVLVGELDPSENVKCAAYGLPRMAVLTNRRILSVATQSSALQGFQVQEVESFTEVRLDDIVRVNSNRGRLSGGIEVFGKNGFSLKFGYVSPKQAAIRFASVAKSTVFGFPDTDFELASRTEKHVETSFKDNLLRDSFLANTKFERSVLSWILRPSERIGGVAPGNVDPGDLLVGEELTALRNLGDAFGYAGQAVIGEPTVAVCTNERVVLLGLWISEEGYWEVPFDQISAVEPKPDPRSGLPISSFTLHGHQSKLFEFHFVSQPLVSTKGFDEKRAAGFTALVTRNVGDATKNSEQSTPTPEPDANPPVTSIADELIKLKGLLDAGAIDQAEFDALKASLIASAR